MDTLPTRTSTKSASKIENFKFTISKMVSQTGFREFMAECIGTFILIAVGNGAVASYTLKEHGAPLDVFAVNFCFGIGAMIGISASMVATGGHINPAVTLTQAFMKKFPWKKVWYFIFAQYLGAFLASGVVYLTYYECIAHFDHGLRSAFGNNTSTGHIFATYPAPHVTILGSFIDQVVGTALLLFAVNAITDAKGINIPVAIQPIALALVITGLCVAYGLNCGAILNPARDFSPRLFTAVAGWGWAPFQPLGGHYWWVAGIVGPHIGAICGAWLYYLSIDQQSSFLKPAISVDTTSSDCSKDPSNGGNVHQIRIETKEKSPM